MAMGMIIPCKYLPISFAIRQYLLQDSAATDNAALLACKAAIHKYLSHRRFTSEIWCSSNLPCIAAPLHSTLAGAWASPALRH